MPPKENEMDTFENEPEHLDNAKKEVSSDSSEHSAPNMDPFSAIASVLGESENLLFNSENQPSEEEHPDANLSEEELVDKYISNVFENGLDTNMILQSHCPICGFRRKKAVEMVALKKTFGKFRLHRTNPENSDENPQCVVGIATMCQNCGHFDIFGTLIQDVLYYLRGKGDKCKGQVETLGTTGGHTNE